MENLETLFGKTFGGRPVKVEGLTASASPRRYFRMYASDGRTVIGTVGTSAEENEAFIYLSEHFRKKGLSVPEIFAVSDDGLGYLQSDLGDSTLWDALKEGRESGEYSEKERALLLEAARSLPDFQCLGAESINWDRCYQRMVFDRRSVLFDLHYFKYCFLKPSGVEYDENLLEDEFEKMAGILCDVPCENFLYRDFQPRNIMCSTEGTLTFIDYQGGRRGPVYYDVASFLWQASARYSDALRRELLDAYLTSLRRYMPVEEKDFISSLRHFVLFRTLQVLAAYGYRGLYEGKVRFRKSIVPALENLVSLFSEDNFFGAATVEYPYVGKLARSLRDAFSEPEETPGLLVEVNSFSYMQGIPRDAWGNGGGYVFDCRGMENPGREPRFYHSTGLDADVSAWLEERGEVQKFLAAAYTIADSHIECYLRRGFRHLSFSFGCTGGQHRSVYCAQHLAEHIASKYGERDIAVRLVHREQGIVKTLKTDGAVRERFGPCLILAAGMGTRLKPLTDYVPKAMAPVGGRPLIISLLDKLYAQGWRETVINLHHDADMLEQYVRFAARDCWSGMAISFSDERGMLLDTGGAVKKMLEEMPAGERKPLLVHNVDIVSDVALSSFYREASGMMEGASKVLAVLMVSDRESSRKLLFDGEMRLRGWRNLKTGQIRGVIPEDGTEFAFDGVYVISPEAAVPFSGCPAAFSIIDFFLKECVQYEIIGVLTPAGTLMKDVGKW